MPTLMLDRLHRSAAAVIAAAGLVLAFAVAEAADSSPKPPAGPMVPEPMSDDEQGFKPIFDGRTLQGWDGDPRYWRVENGSLVGETTATSGPKGQHSFILWRGGSLADFELKLTYRVTPEGNSGVEYRGTRDPQLPWNMRGNQAPIIGSAWVKWLFKESGEAGGWDDSLRGLSQLTGLNFDHHGRGYLALPGQLSYVGAGQVQRMQGALAAPETLAAAISDNWNKLHLIARGDLMIHIINGRVMSVVIDDDSARRHLSGVLGLKVAGRPAMKVEFRDIRLKAKE